MDPCKIRKKELSGWMNWQVQVSGDFVILQAYREFMI